MMKQTQGSKLPRVIQPSGGAGLEFGQLEGGQGSVDGQGEEFMDPGQLQRTGCSSKNNLIAYI